jgi:Kef-type K+ transport system membrane component KefB
VEIALPAVLILVAATVALVVWFGLRASHAVTAFLAGVFVAGTSAGPHIHNAVSSFGHWLSTL